MEKLFAKIKKENLSPEEKSKILSSLKAFTAENPVRSIRSPFYDEWFVFIRQKSFAIPVAALLIIILTGGTVFAANSSLPGSVLYPIKKLSENIQSSVAMSPKSRAIVDASHAISRLSEVEQIVTSGGQLSSSTSQEIQSRFEAQSQQAISNINQLSSSGQSSDASDASKIQSDFHKSLGEHERVITNLSNSTSTQNQTRQELSNVVSNIHSQLERTSSTTSNGTEDNGSKNRGNGNKNQGEVRGAETSTTTDTRQATSTQRTNTERNRSHESESEGND